MHFFLLESTCYSGSDSGYLHPIRSIRFDRSIAVSFSRLSVLQIYSADAFGGKDEIKPISDRVVRASATEKVDSISIPSWVKPNTIKIGIHNFPAWPLVLKRTVDASAVTVGQVVA